MTVTKPLRDRDADLQEAYGVRLNVTVTREQLLALCDVADAAQAVLGIPTCDACHEDECTGHSDLCPCDERCHAREYEARDRLRAALRALRETMPS